MLLREYLSEISNIINEFANTGIILSSEVTTDFRTEKIGSIKGIFVFVDGSKLFFTEYLDLRYGTHKQTYSYHYQAKDSKLIFRYDNALHKPKLGCNEHKHVGNDIIPSGIPSLADTLEEIFCDYLCV